MAAGKNYSVKSHSGDSSNLFWPNSNWRLASRKHQSGKVIVLCWATFIKNMVKNNFPISASEVVEIGFVREKNVFKPKFSNRTEIAMRRTGCFHLATRSYHELSGGEKQRV